MKSKGPESKFLWTNTVTSSRALVKSHKVLQKDSPEAFLEKKLIWEIPRKILRKETIIEVLSSVTSQPATSLKKNSITVIFRWLWKRFFRILFYVRALIKQQKELKYSAAYVLEKSWSEEFHKIYPKETMVESFFS